MHHVCGIIIFVPGSKKLKTKNVFYFRISLPYSKNADVAELADAPDLGSGVTDVGVQVPSSAPNLCVELFLVPRIFYFPAKPNHPSPLARSLWKGLSPIKQSTGLFYLRLVFIRTKFMRGAIFSSAHILFPRKTKSPFAFGSVSLEGTLAYKTIHRIVLLTARLHPHQIYAWSYF